MTRSKKFLAVALAAIARVDATAVCDYPTTNTAAEDYRAWFATLAEIAQESLAASLEITATNIATEIGSASVSAPASLIAALTNPSGCKALLVQLVNDMKTNLTYQKSLGNTDTRFTCPTGATYVSATDGVAWSYYTCTRLMAAATDKFNIAANNGFDIITGEKYRRMTLAQYIDIERRFQPYNAMVTLAGKLSATNDPFSVWGAQIPTLMGSDNFVTVLNAATAPTTPSSSESYKLCFVEFFASVRTILGGSASNLAACSTSDLASSDGCKLILKVPINKYHQCIGEHYVHYKLAAMADRCSSTNMWIFDNVYRAYTPVASCYDKVGYEFLKCVGDKSGLPLNAVGAVECLNCWIKLGSDMSVVNATGCLTNSTVTNDCLNKIDGTLMDANVLAQSQMKTPLTEFTICSGYRMNTSSTLCTSSDVTAIVGKRVQLITVLNATMNAVYANNSSPQSVVMAMGTVLPTEITSSTCAPSFGALAVDLYQNRKWLQSSCVPSVNSTSCSDTISSLGILKSFKASSGSDLSSLLVVPTPTVTPVGPTNTTTTTKSASVISVGAGIMLLLMFVM
jgi:hypothetical protein